MLSSCRLMTRMHWSNEDFSWANLKVRDKFTKQFVTERSKFQGRSILLFITELKKFFVSDLYTQKESDSFKTGRLSATPMRSHALSATLMHSVTLMHSQRLSCALIEYLNLLNHISWVSSTTLSRSRLARGDDSWRKLS